MRRDVRVGLILGAAACLLAVAVSWVIEELTAEASPPSVDAPEVNAEVPQAGTEAPQAAVEAEVLQADIEGAQAAADGSHGQG